VAIPHVAPGGRLAGEKTYEMRLQLCRAAVLDEMLSSASVLKVTVRLDSLEFPLSKAAPTLKDFLSQFSEKSVEVILESRELRELRRKGEEDARRLQTEGAIRGKAKRVLSNDETGGESALH
jgi:hypothetical protein